MSSTEKGWITKVDAEARTKHLTNTLEGRWKRDVNIESYKERFSPLPSKKYDQKTHLKKSKTTSETKSLSTYASKNSSSVKMLSTQSGDEIAANKEDVFYLAQHFGYPYGSKIGKYVAHQTRTLELFAILNASVYPRAIPTFAQVEAELNKKDIAEDVKVNLERIVEMQSSAPIEPTKKAIISDIDTEIKAIEDKQPTDAKERTNYLQLLKAGKLKNREETHRINESYYDLFNGFMSSELGPQVSLKVKSIAGVHFNL